MIKIKYIIFDLGGVVLKHKKGIIEEFLSSMFSVSFAKASRIWQDYKKLLASGKTNSHEFLFELKHKFNSTKNIAELDKMWIELYKKEAQNVNYSLLSYISKLKKEYKLVLFTDTIKVHDDYNKNRGIYDNFDKVIKSFEEGMIKTQKTAFKNLLKKLDAKPRECVFIDDSKENIKMAENLGIKSILFKNNKQLKKEIKVFL
jgi:epoxide hydrolase-like predicted phosphatase